jgi:hypothetical protein
MKTIDVTHVHSQASEWLASNKDVLDARFFLYPVGRHLYAIIHGEADAARFEREVLGVEETTEADAGSHAESL